MSGKRKDVQALLRRAEQAGCTLSKSNSGHLHLCGPNGGRVVVSATPSCPRTLCRVRTDIRRYLGVNL